MARDFSTAGDKLEVASDAAQDIAIGSIHFLMNTSQAQNFITLHAKHGPGATSNNGFILFINDTAGSTLRVQIIATSAVLDMTGSTDIRDGADHSCGLVFRQANSGTCRLYVDGSEEVNGTTSGAWTFDSQVLRWAISTDAFWTDMTGVMSETAWWDVELNVSEWAALSKRVSPRLIRPASLIDYWQIIGTNSPEQSRISTRSATVTGTTKVGHPRIILPAPTRLIHVPAAAAVGNPWHVYAQQ